MPDWSYHPAKQLLLQSLSARQSRLFIHKFMNTIATIPGGSKLIQFLGHTKPPAILNKQLNHISFRAPIGLSCKVDPYMLGTKAFQHLGFGLLEIGPIVIDQPTVQKPPIIEQDQILFAKTAEKITLQQAVIQLSGLPKELPILANIDPSVTMQELSSIMSKLAPYVAGYIIPQSIDAAVSTTKPIYVAYELEELNIATLNEKITALQADGILLHAPIVEHGNYVAEAEQATDRLISCIQKVKQHFPTLTVITSGGINEPQDSLLLTEAGADLMLLTGGYVTAGPGLTKRSYELIVHHTYTPKQATTYIWSMLFGLSILLAGLIALYFSFTGVILPYDETFIGLTKEQIFTLNPRLLYFMAHDRMALAGTMISASILYLQIARHGLSRHWHWCKIAFHSAAIVGFLGILLFIGYGYFDWLHGLFWLVLSPIYWLSLREAKQATLFASSPYGTNHRNWRLANYGQLMFVILGGALLIGGIVISLIGISSVYISTDLAYLCMSAEMIQQINEFLTPVIAHDRAGFGSALVSVGLLVFILALWGYREGEAWLWNTFAIGAIPAFAAGIGTHFFIGYTTFIHLLPVYFLVVIYAIGLILSYPYLKQARNS